MAAEDALCGKGYELTMFLFTDIIVVAKVGPDDHLEIDCMIVYFRGRRPKVWG